VDVHLAREKADRPVYQPPAPVLARVRPAVIAQVPVDPVNQIDAPLQNGDPPHSPDDLCLLLMLSLFDIIWDMLPDMMHITKGK
jgi:hypothetical protein